MLGAIHKGRPRRGCEGGFRNLDNLGHREGGLIQQPENPSLKKNKNKKTFVFVESLYGMICLLKILLIVSLILIL